MFITERILRTALEMGLIYSLTALALWISYGILKIADLSTDGCFTLGCAVGAVWTVAGHPVLGIFLAMASGVLSGLVNGLLQTKLGIQSILAGIIVNSGLYTVNIFVMGSSNLSLYGSATVYDLVEGWMPQSAWWGAWGTLAFLACLVTGACFLLYGLMRTRLGLSIRAAGDNPAMVKASSINPQSMTVVGLCIAGALTGLSGCLCGQYNGNSDINLGTGMVTVALASLVIGEILFRAKGIGSKIAGVVGGAVIYRLAMSLALRLHVPPEAFKLVSALIVAAALSVNSLRARSKEAGRRKRGKSRA